MCTLHAGMKYAYFVVCERSLQEIRSIFSFYLPGAAFLCVMFHYSSSPKIIYYIGIANFFMSVSGITHDGNSHAINTRRGSSEA